MFLDASAIVAILGREPGYEELEKRLATAPGPFFVSPLVKFEASLALARQKSKGRKPTPTLLKQASTAVEAFVEDIAAEEIAISSEIGCLAFDASTRYGKAVGHLADLNFGDCFAYACAKSLDVPLFYKGDDFAETDLARWEVGLPDLRFSRSAHDSAMTSAPALGEGFGLNRSRRPRGTGR